ncbi:MAG: tRNA lysidine(34) synthetase TilS [Eubacteriales bacterium]|nr:tRNA lysidine(34) synthetase TilS [Eubacteriales bacterium]
MASYFGRCALRAQVKDFIVTRGLLPSGSRAAVAVSGGADSVALLHVLCSLRRELGVELCAVHFNHHLRVESDEEALFVERLCREWDVPFFCGEAQVKELARAEHISVEVAARTARHAFFRVVCTQQRCTALCTAHHGDDQAETVLLRLLRGAGTAGLAAMAPREETGIVRPLLGVTRGQIRQYCAEEGLSWREDASNACLDIPRNRVRHELLPYLRQHFNPGVSRVLSRTASLLRADEDYLEEQAAQAYGALRLPGSEEGLEAAGLLGLHEALSRRVIRRAVKAVGVCHDLEADHVEAVLALLKHGHTGESLDLPMGLKAVRDAQALVFYFPHEKVGYEVPLLGEGEFACPSGTLRVEAAQRPHSLRHDNALEQWVDAEALQGAVLRTRRMGDGICPLGAPGSKKLKDFLIDKKIPARLRDALPLVCAGDRVLWAVGLCLSRQAAVTPITSRVLRLQFIPNHQSEGEKEYEPGCERDSVR